MRTSETICKECPTCHIWIALGDSVYEEHLKQCANGELTKPCTAGVCDGYDKSYDESTENNAHD